ncbi:Gfo/Idh/MocA family protein [Myxococcus xanthus]|uniref:Gfo/Idh/MocA family protein n=1 Tax=Myxococcus xanthus TaxID=34 RepID=UPI0011284ADE|nr:Gfo/Idh/MocA family oxidoreductase [Myxococcus xanthus]QDE96294.1 hypothetical protein BHS05_10810 [Myxococcus xanthus]
MLSPVVEHGLGARKQKIRVGIIGASSTGGWALFGHLPALKMLPQYVVTAVCATNQEHADEVARRHGVPHAFNRPKALVTHPEVDLVVISVKAPEHDALVRAAIAAQKDVFCEWPLGTSTAQAAALTKLAEAAKVRTVIGLQRRLSPGVRYLRDLLDEGYVETPRLVPLHAASPMYAAFARDVAEGTRLAPDFSEALKLHRLLDAIEKATATGRRQTWTEPL